MNDLLPEDTRLWQFMERTITGILAAYGYAEIRLPILEFTELFERTIGEVTDIVEKEMYTFHDRNGDSVTMRPEGTAGCVRAAEENGLLYNQLQRLWYAGPMFRHERPQKGRYRQFHQIGVEAFGMEGPDIDAELILMNQRFWQALGLADSVRLELNSLGTAESRAHFREDLVKYLSGYRERLDEDSRRRLASNPLRILDSKDEGTQALLAEGPKLPDYLDAESQAHFAELTAILDAAGIDYRINSNLVRGLDYYGKTVFEWVSTELGAQGTLCAGGRYDGLVAQLGGKQTPAIGFALGMERLALLLSQREDLEALLEPRVDVYLVAVGEGAARHALLLAERLRRALPALRLVCHAGGGGFKSQMKKADKSGAPLALVLGEDEIAEAQVTLKRLRESAEQETFAQSEAPARLAAILERSGGA